MSSGKSSNKYTHWNPLTLISIWKKSCEKHTIFSFFSCLSWTATTRFLPKCFRHQRTENSGTSPEQLTYNLFLFSFPFITNLFRQKSVISSQNALGHRQTRISSDKPQQQGTIHHRPSNLDTEGFVKTPLVSENIENWMNGLIE